MPDPKLKMAMDEIKAVLKQHDIGAVVVLGSQTHCEFLREYTPTWACMSLEQHDGQMAIRIRALRKDFPSLEAHKQCLEDSVGLLMGFIDVLEREREQLIEMVARVAKVVEIEHMTKAEQ